MIKFKVGDKVIRIAYLDLYKHKVPISTLTNPKIKRSILKGTVLTIKWKIEIMSYEAYTVKEMGGAIYPEELKLAKITNWRERIK